MADEANLRMRLMIGKVGRLITSIACSEQTRGEECWKHVKELCVHDLRMKWVALTLITNLGYFGLGHDECLERMLGVRIALKL